MKRYSKKEKVGYSLATRQYVSYHQAVKKLGQIEDLEEKLNIELLDLFNLIGKKVYYFTKTMVREAEILDVNINKHSISIQVQYWIDERKGKYGKTYCGHYKRRYIGLFNRTNTLYGWAFTYEEAEKFMDNL